MESHPVQGELEGLRWGAEEGDAAPQLRDLPAQRCGAVPPEQRQDPLGFLERIDLQHRLHAQLIKIQPVALLHVRRRGLGVVVEQDHVPLRRPEGPGAANGRKILLAPLPDAAGPGAEDDDGLGGGVQGGHVAGRVVGEVENISLGFHCPSQDVNLRYSRPDPMLPAHIPDLQLSTGSLHDPGQLVVGEPAALGKQDQVRPRVQVFQSHPREFQLHGDHRPHFGQEPGVNPSGIVNFVHRHIPLQGLRDHPDPLGGRCLEGGQELLLGLQRLRNGAGLKPTACGAGHPEGLLEGLFEGAAKSEDFTHGLLAHIQLSAVGRLVRRPDWGTDSDIVHGGLAAGCGGLRHQVAELNQVRPHGQAGGDVGNGVP
mmetsp:Transcript_37996/g.85095  ORF Transcript_37996/g.85095 Transcript_37996/m.85095 type:complete len:370 (+) Transcript_37996:1308-2417(+)